MATVTRDIIGSTLSINDDFREDKATRRVFVKLETTDTGGTTRAGTAILKAIENQNAHPENGCTAPLRNASAKQVGADVFEVTLAYYHTRARYENTTSLFSMSPVQPHKRLKVACYRSPYKRAFDPRGTNPIFEFGLPAGDTLFPEGSDLLVALGYRRSFFLPTYELSVQGKINAGRANELRPPLESAGIVNADGFVYGGLTFPKNSLRFDSMSIRYIDEKPNDTAGLFYLMNYNFTFCPYGFRTHALIEQTNGVASVETTGVSVGPLVSFAGLFPGIS